MTTSALFKVLGSILQELKDGHINIFFAFNTGCYRNWFQDKSTNYNQEIIDSFDLKNDYKIAREFRYKILPNNIGYIHYKSFADPINEANLYYILFCEFYTCKGIIVDIRNNSGEILYYFDLIASHFIILTNRSCYNTCNNFVNTIRYALYSIIIRDKIGNKLPIYFYSEISISWIIRYSSALFFDDNTTFIENGINPDILIPFLLENIQKGHNTLIETTYCLLNDKHIFAKLLYKKRRTNTFEHSQILK